MAEQRLGRVRGRARRAGDGAARPDLRRVSRTRCRGTPASRVGPKAYSARSCSRATVIVTLVVGAFDAVLLIAPPTLFVWLLLGVYSEPVSQSAPRQAMTTGVRQWAPVIVFGLGLLAGGPERAADDGDGDGDDEHSHIGARARVALRSGQLSHSSTARGSISQHRSLRPRPPGTA